MADAREMLRRKRDGEAHDPAALRDFVAAFARGEVPDYQMSAWLMAAFLNGLDERETDALTQALLHSGRVFDWTGLGRPTADKHSTGGVGDKVSLVLAPLVAACGVLVPMVSGRGLGHTGGTLDKLESIPGFRTQLDPEAMRAQLDRLGVVMVGQGPDLAPADGRLYALRDVTATIENESFIVPSIVSKKIAEGARAIAYDVKCGNGAFMKTAESAGRLARRLIATSRALGARAGALVTDMSQPLGRTVGNALEVRESVDLLRGGGPGDVRAITLDLAAMMLRLAGAEPDAGSARRRAERALDDGSAWARFVAMVEAQGGRAASLEREDGLPRAPRIGVARAPRAGTVIATDAFALGEIVVRLGGGRAAKEDPVDPRVGLVVLRRVGDAVSAGDPLAEVHLAGEEEDWTGRVAACFRIEPRAAEPPPLVIERLEDAPAASGP